MKIKSDEKIMFQIMADPKYRGRYVIVIDKEVYSAKSGPKHTQLLEKLLNKYPGKTPLISYVPKEDLLILTLK